MAGLTIARLAATAGVGVETVRYYQRRGLLDVPASAGAIRRYGPADVARLRFVRSAQGAGFTLEEIGQLLASDRVADRDGIRALAEKRMAALDDQIAQLQKAREALGKLAADCASGSGAACPILEAFETPAAA